MDAERYRRTVPILCPTCGNDQFEHEDESGSFRCISCDRMFTREELTAENDEAMEAELQEMAAEVFKDAAKELRQKLQNSLLGSKHIKFK